MKVLKNNYIGVTPEEIEVNPFPKGLLCDGCGSELEYEKSDIEFGAYGCGSIKCPLCEYNNELWTKDECLSLTIDNVEFPTHFHHTSIETGAVDISNEEIKKYIQKAINFFRNNKDEFSWFTETGTLHIAVWRMDGDESYEVVVSKDHYATSIPFEEIDYNPDWKDEY